MKARHAGRHITPRQVGLALVPKAGRAPEELPTGMDGYARRAVASGQSTPTRMMIRAGSAMKAVSPAVPHQPRALVHTGSWMPPASAAAAGGAARPPSRR